MPIRPRAGGALQTATALSVLAGGALRPARAVKMMVGGSLVTVFNGATTGGGGALTLSAPASAEGSGFSAQPQRVYTNAVTATPSGGSALFTYAWSIDNANIRIEAPTSATTQFSAVLFGSSAFGSASVTATDAFGASGTATVAVTLTHERDI